MGAADRPALTKCHDFFARWGKVCHSVLGVCLVQMALSSPPQDRGEVRKRVWNLLGNYSPTSYTLLRQYYAAPSTYGTGRVTIRLGEATDFLEFVDGGNEQGIVGSLNTVVHEICHGYTQRCAYVALQKRHDDLSVVDREYSLFYIDTARVILVRHTKVFRTMEIQSDIPQRFRTSRFSTYIYPSRKQLGAQVHGVYGLLDEWNAYYHGTRTAVELLRYYREKARESPTVWLDYFSDVDGTLHAHGEFKYFILKYLQFARRQYPRLYDDLVSNREFCEAYRVIDSCFTETRKVYESSKAAILQELYAKGHKVGEDEEYIWINNVGRGNSRKVYKDLLQEVEGEAYQGIRADLEP